MAKEFSDDDAQVRVTRWYNNNEQQWEIQITLSTGNYVSINADQALTLMRDIYKAVHD